MLDWRKLRRLAQQNELFKCYVARTEGSDLAAHSDLVNVNTPAYSIAEIIAAIPQMIPSTR
jgi:hypothetical protein